MARCVLQSQIGLLHLQRRNLFYHCPQVPFGGGEAHACPVGCCLQVACPSEHGGGGVVPEVGGGDFPAGQEAGVGGGGGFG